MPAKTFECPHCAAAVPAALDELDAASAVLECPGCRRPVYLIMGKLSHFQPGDQPAGYQASYDSGD